MTGNAEFSPIADSFSMGFKAVTGHAGQAKQWLLFEIPEEGVSGE